MKKLFIFVLLSITSVQAQVSQQWVARYHGPGNTSDGATSIAVDGSGNVYVTGFSVGSGTNYDYATIKYNSSGVLQWSSRYNGPGNNDDRAHSIAVDGSGNVYVTGNSMGSGTSQDYVTIKYNSSGDSLWVQRYNGLGNNADVANSIVVDGSGNVYVTGESYGSGTVQDYVTIKYNSSGVQQWVQRYNGSAGTGDVAFSIAVDGSGNVYVTGLSAGSGSNYDYVTIKYNSSGDSLWVVRYNGPGNNYDQATSITVDGSGNVFVTGGSSNGTNYDCATIKYNSSGVQLWVSRYNGTGNGDDEAHSIAVDASGNVYVTGQSQGSGSGLDYATIKYNSSGVQQWEGRYNGPGNYNDRAFSLALDGSGNVYVTGSNYGNGSSYDYTTIKYTPTGVQQWIQIYDGPGNSQDNANSIVVGSSGNVYVTGSSFGSGTTDDYCTIKYIQTPTSSPNLFSPTNNSQGWGLTILLVWYRMPDISNYHVQASTDSLFANIILNDSTITDSTKGVGGLQNNTYYFWRVAAKNAAGISPWSAVWKFRTGFVGIQPVSNEIPNEFKLYDNYPNPFNPTTKMKFTLPKSSFANLIVYDALGRELETLINEQLSAGIYEVDWNASQYSSGVYYYKIVSDDYTETKRMVLLK